MNPSNVSQYVVPRTLSFLPSSPSLPGAIITNIPVAPIAEAAAWPTAELVHELNWALCWRVSDWIVRRAIDGVVRGCRYRELCIYRLCTTVYESTGDTLPVLVARMWCPSDEIMYRCGLWDGVWPFALAAVCRSSIVKARVRKLYTRWLLRVIPVAIGK